MINNIATMDLRPQMAVAKPMASVSSFSMPPILGFKTPPLKEKAIIKVKKVKRGDNIIILGEIEDDYVDIVEEILPQNNSNFFTSQEFVSPPIKRQIKYLKNCYIIDYIQSPKARCGLGTEAIQNGFRFTSPEANQYMEECIIKKIPDIPAQVGMMYLPKSRLHKLLRYGELF